jgi:hypothetical protein
MNDNVMAAAVHECDGPLVLAAGGVAVAALLKLNFLRARRSDDADSENGKKSVILPMPKAVVHQREGSITDSAVIREQTRKRNI